MHPRRMHLWPILYFLGPATIPAQLLSASVFSVALLMPLSQVVVLTGGGAAAWVVYTRILQSQGELPPGF